MFLNFCSASLCCDCSTGRTLLSRSASSLARFRGILIEFGGDKRGRKVSAQCGATKSCMLYFIQARVGKNQVCNSSGSKACPDSSSTCQINDEIRGLKNAREHNRAPCSAPTVSDRSGPGWFGPYLLSADLHMTLFIDLRTSNCRKVRPLLTVTIHSQENVILMSSEYMQTVYARQDYLR